MIRLTDLIKSMDLIEDSGVSEIWSAKILDRANSISSFRTTEGRFRNGNGNGPSPSYIILMFLPVDWRAVEPNVIALSRTGT